MFPLENRFYYTHLVPLYKNNPQKPLPKIYWSLKVLPRKTLHKIVLGISNCRVSKVVNLSCFFSRTYREYYLDYYYGRSNGGGFGRLTKKEGDSPELSGKLIKKDDKEGVEEKQTETQKEE